MPLLLATFEKQVKAIQQEAGKAGAAFGRRWTPATGGLILFSIYPAEPDAN
jgi:hypothetical protein